MLFLKASKSAGLARAAWSLSSMAEIFLNGRFSATTRSAKATAPARRSSPTTSSTMPISLALGARTGSPLTIILSAASTPATRGNRCVPPAPGRSPSLTSGSPTCPAATATR